MKTVTKLTEANQYRRLARSIIQWVKGLVLLTSVAIVVGGCGGWSGPPAVAPPPPPPPPPVRTFETDIRPLVGRCAGCHPALLPSAGSMADYDNVISKGYVKPKDPDASPYYTKPSGKAPHAGGATWAQDADLIREWISQGAKR